MCATTTSRYWNDSRPTCSWNPNCGKGGNITDSTTCANYSGAPDGLHNSIYNQIYSQNNSVYTTSAASGSFGLEIIGQYDCNNVANEKIKGIKFITIVTNLCPDWNNGKRCPPIPQDKNIRNANYHFDIAIVGGDKCSDPIFAEGCKVYLNQLGCF